MDDFPGSRRSSDAAVDPSAAAGLRVLIVDDNAEYRAYFAAIARRHGWETVTAPDGEAALGAMREAAFDLVLVDFEMPRLDGMQLVAQVRADHSLRNVYAIMITARDDMETKISALNAGFDDFLPKSASEGEIVAKLLATRRVLSRQQNLDVAVRRLYTLATRDELTGVFNRRFFLDEAARLLGHGPSICLVLFDLDDFKAINDTYGHVAGDRVLRDVGATLLAGTRTEDLLARYGGDEFVLVATCLPLVAVERIAARLAAAVAELRWSTGTSSFGISTSVGIASSALLPAGNVEQLLNAADRHLYTSKWLRKHPRAAGPVPERRPPQQDVVLETAPRLELVREAGGPSPSPSAVELSRG